MQHAALVLLGLTFGLGLAGGIEMLPHAALEATAADEGQAHAQAPAQAQGQFQVPALQDAAAPCVPVLDARPGGAYVALAWTSCPAGSYQLLRGASPEDLAPLVELNHAGHVDIAPLAVGYYAVRAGDGPLSAPVVIALS